MVKTKNILSNRRDALTRLLLLLAILLLANIVSRLYYFRLDLTSEKRYSISKPTKNLLRNLKDVVTVKVYLDGDLNAGFTRLKESTRNLMNEFRAYGGRNIEFQFIDPMSIQNLDERKAMMTDLMQRGLAPTNLTTKSKTGTKQQLIFPGAIVMFAGREMPVQLLDNQIGFSPEEVLNNSDIQLEYKFANAVRKLTALRAVRVAFLHGHGELDEVYTADLRKTLTGLRYELRDIDIIQSYHIPDEVDAVVIAKPRARFEDKDKYKIDQYIMRGGKVLWLIDGTDADMDSLRLSPVGQFAIANELNLEDMLFKYGVRVNNDLVQDVNMCNQIPLVVGQMGNAPQTEMFPWYYFPLLISDNNHAIIKNLDPVASYFPSSIDTIKNPGVRKTILLHTSDNSKRQLTPCRVHFGILQGKPLMSYYNEQKVPVAVLLEGQFESVFKNRLSPETMAAFDTVKSLKFSAQSPASKMIVISNGNIISNELRSDSSVYPLGYDKFTRQQFANKDFILNCIEYLTDTTGILETRNKEVKLRLLNKVKADDERLKWQMINLVMPIAVIVVLGLIFNYYRRKKYAQ